MIIFPGKLYVFAENCHDSFGKSVQFVAVCAMMGLSLTKKRVNHEKVNIQSHL